MRRITSEAFWQFAVAHHVKHLNGMGWIEIGSPDPTESLDPKDSIVLGLASPLETPSTVQTSHPVTSSHYACNSSIQRKTLRREFLLGLHLIDILEVINIHLKIETNLWLSNLTQTLLNSRKLFSKVSFPPALSFLIEGSFFSSAKGIPIAPQPHCSSHLKHARLPNVPEKLKFSKINIEFVQNQLNSIQELVRKQHEGASQSGSL